MSDADPERDPLDVLAEEFAERFRRGETPAVSEYLARYPQWAEQLRELLPPVAHMEKLKRLKQACRTEAANGPQLKQLGDYRILREVGRGGMGVVYEAVQQSLGRHVALKVLPTQALRDPKKLERFRREAQAAANLHHTNIVPVFGVGEQDGVHYYAMQFIEGQGLDRVLVEWKHGSSAGKRPHTAAGRHRSTDSWREPAPRPAPDTAPNGWEVDGGPATSGPPPTERARTPAASRWRTVARIGAEAAEALHYAHQQGVLHRDVKPANLLLDTHGAVWVTDFGLAKVVSEEGLTCTGDVLGTLQYMAPESLERRGDARSDVYSLGVTLYELLTLEPAFRGGDPAQVLGAVYGRELVPPRKAHPAIPHDLETVVLKATARDPGRRYPTAQALAADLRRFLEDRPIQARRTTPAERLWRWCRRNPAVALLTAALVLVFLGGFAGVVWKWQEAEAEGRRAEKNLRRAEAESRRAEKNEQLSLKALEDIFELFARGEAGPGGRGGPARRFDSPEDIALLQTILKFYDQFARENATNAKLRREAALAYRRVGDIEQRFGQRAKASAAYRRAAAILEELTEGPAATPESRLEWAETFTQPEDWPEGGRGLKEGEERLRKALAIAADPGEAPSGRRVAAAARAQTRLGAVLEKRDRPGEAEAAHRDAVRRWRFMSREPHKTPMWEFELCTAHRALAAFLLRRERLADARTATQESINDLEGWRAGPVEWVRKGLMREQYQSLAATLTRLGETAQAAEATRAAEEFGQDGPPPKGGPRPVRDKKSRR
jgi:serine/threonine protein kinase